MTPSCCKVCGGAAPSFLGYVPFNKTCNGVFRLAPFKPVEYYRCETCAFIFTSDFDHWRLDQWRNTVYNSAYDVVDPDASGHRPVMFASLLRQFVMRDARILDYGSWHGEFAKQMSTHNVTSYEPLSHAKPEGTFDMVTCIETIEHSPRPQEIADDLCALQTQGGRIFISTLTGIEGIDHWYVAPRNGHVSIYSKLALATLFKQRGRVVLHMHEGWHMVMPPGVNP